MKERLQKLLANRGLCSRRDAENLIRERRVSINGIVAAELGTKVDAECDTVMVDGRLLPPRKRAKTIMLYKPRGYLSTCSVSREQGRSVLTLIPNDRRYYPVGRLDKDSEGLLLLTDDGDLAYRLTHPKHDIDKVYLVETADPLSRQIKKMLSGIDVDGSLAHAVDVSAGDKLCTYRVVLHEGRKRQIRRMIEVLGTNVISLKRVQIGELTLGSLKQSQWRVLTDGDLDLLIGNPVQETPDTLKHRRHNHVSRG